MVNPPTSGAISISDSLSEIMRSWPGIGRLGEIFVNMIVLFLTLIVI